MNNIYWLAGLLEGEASFRLCRNRYPQIHIAMTDKEIIERAAGLIKVKIYGPYHKIKYKDIYGFCIIGTKAAEWMMTLFSLMGTNCKQKIKSALDMWITTKPKYHTCINHPNRKHLARGFCGMCYRRLWRAERKA